MPCNATPGTKVPGAGVPVTARYQSPRPFSKGGFRGIQARLITFPGGSRPRRAPRRSGVARTYRRLSQKCLAPLLQLDICRKELQFPPQMPIKPIDVGPDATAMGGQAAPQRPTGLWIVIVQLLALAGAATVAILTAGS